MEGAREEEAHVPAPVHLYDEEAVREILERALGLQGRDFTRTDLATMAQDLGITPEQLRLAEEAWRSEQASWDEEAERRRFIATRRRKFRNDLLSWFLYVALAVLAFQSGFAILPLVAIIAAFPLFFAALELIEEGNKALLQTVGDDFEKEFDEWLEQRDERRQRRLTRTGARPSG